MASSQAPESTSTNKRHGLGDALGRYLRGLEGAPLAGRTRDSYSEQVRSYVSWLDGGVADPGAALRDTRARDLAARDYKRYLKGLGWKPASVNLALAAVDHFNRFLGLGPADVRREELARQAPRALGREEQRGLLRSAEVAGARDRAIVTVLLYTGLRLSELQALDVADVRVSARKGLVVVRSGKGDAYREVPLNSATRAAVDGWLSERAGRAAECEPAFLVSRRGGRLSARAIDLAVRRVAEGAGLSLSAHVLRHTCVTNLVRGGHDIVLVAELAGHRRLETTRRYSLPSDADRQAAMESIELDDS